MRTALDAHPSVLDEHETNVVAKIREHGWFQTSVYGDDEGPGFSYTTGFWLKFNFPELITFSLRRDIANDKFWKMYRDLAEGGSFSIGVPVQGILKGIPAVLLPVPEWRFSDYLGWSRWFYGGNQFKCLQLVWPDANEKFPWQAGCSPDLTADQPDLTDASWAGLREH
jgi:hypothetical protein